MLTVWYRGQPRVEANDVVDHRGIPLPAPGAGQGSYARARRGQFDFAATVCLFSKEAIGPDHRDLSFHFNGIVLYQVGNPRVNVFRAADLLLHGEGRVCPAGRGIELLQALFSSTSQRHPVKQRVGHRDQRCEVTLLQRRAAYGSFGQASKDALCPLAGRPQVSLSNPGAAARWCSSFPG